MDDVVCMYVSTQAHSERKKKKKKKNNTLNASKLKLS